MPRLVLALGACVVTALAACTSGESIPATTQPPDASPALTTVASPTDAAPASNESPTPPSESPTVPSAEQTPVASTCSGALPPGLAAGESRLQQLSVGVDVRTYLVYVPSSFENTRLAPLVLNFHGLGGFAEGQERRSGLVPIAEREGFILVTPQGAGATPSWNFGAGQGIFQGAPDDFGFVSTLLDTLGGQLCIDPARVYATGFSNGAFFASGLACTMPGRFAAVAPVAGVNYPIAGCPEVVPLLAFHGTSDSVVPFLAGSIFQLLHYDGARANVAGWAEVGGCEAAPYPEQLGGDASLESYDCDGGVHVALVVIEGLDHAWPDIAAERIWAFFERYSLAS